jgi:hypothetical protein
MAMKLYPDMPARRSATIARDLLVLGLIVLFAWFGVKVYDTVERLNVLGRGVESAGSSVSNGFQTAADAVGHVPVVGRKLADGLTSGGQQGGDTLASLGRSGQEQVHRMALALGLAMSLIPIGFMLVLYLPGRWRHIREMTDATRLLAHASDPARRLLLAQRAAFGLPVEALLRFTPDPIGDLAAGRLDRLVDAIFADAGLRAPSIEPHTG